MKHTRYFLAGLTILCVFMIAVTSIRGSLLNPLRNAVGALLVPVQSGINAVGGGIYKEVSAMTELRQALSENEKLQAQVDELTEENTRLRSEEQELSRLRELYQLDQDYMEYNKVGARIIAKDSSSWFSVFRIDKGSEDGIRENMNVIAGGGLVGIVTDVGTNYATFAPLSTIPARSAPWPSSRETPVLFPAISGCLKRAGCGFPTWKRTTT